MIKNKKMVISIPLSLMAIFFSFKVGAYAFTQDYAKGFYWQTFPVNMKRFATNSTDGNNLQELVDEAVSEWESAVGTNIWSIDNVIQSTNYVGNYIRWSDNFGAETGYDPSSTLAVTIRYNRGTFIEQVVILLNSNVSYLKQNWGNTLKTTILHEIGHTIGLDHSNDQNAIMYPTLGGVTRLQSDDIQGMTALVHDTQYRQQTGFTSPYSASSDSQKVFPACGSIEDIGSKGGRNDDNEGKGGGNSGAGNFICALLMGVLFGSVFGGFRKIKFMF